MFKQLRISQKLPLYMAVMALMGSLVTGLVSYWISSASIQSEVENEMQAVLSAKKNGFDSYLHSIETDLQTIAKNNMAIEGIQKFSHAWRKLQNPEETLQNRYITDNPHPLGEKDNLNAANDGSLYSATHAQYHPWFRTFLRAKGYYDIFLFDLDGNLIYSVFKENDYATNLLTGKWKETGLGLVVKDVLKDFRKDKIAFQDFAPYAPSYDAPASFIGAPVFNRFGGKQGVLVYQMPIQGINDIMDVSLGMGQTGETYIVGRDNLMRSQARNAEEGAILKTKVSTTSAEQALKGETGVGVTQNYRGDKVISAYEPITFQGTSWAIVAEKSYDEALEKINSLALYIALTVVILCSLVSLIGYFLIKPLIKDILRSSQALKEAADGNLNNRIINITRQDELGVLQKSLNGLLDRTEAFCRESGAALEYASRDEFFRRILPEGMVGTFATRAKIINQGLEAMESKTTTFENNASSMGSNIREVVQSVLSTVTEMQASAETMNTTANDTSQQSNVVAQSAQSSSHNVENVAAATEEFSASINEVSQQVNRSAELSRSAVEKAQSADTTIHSLSEAASRISQVVNLINDIAEQTNLLALNATIEAARAGEAGKGFAVVAGEVKNLANQTAQATDEIVLQIKSMQSATSDAVSAIAEVGEIINVVEESNAAIAEAVEQQRGAVMEISSSVQEAVQGVNTVANIINDVAEGANSTSQASTEITSASNDLQNRAVNLNSDLDAFLQTVTKQIDLENVA